MKGMMGLQFMMALLEMVWKLRDLTLLLLLLIYLHILHGSLSECMEHRDPHADISTFIVLRVN